MIGIVLVTHGRLAEEFLWAAEHVVGKQSHAEAICIQPDDDIEARRLEIEEAASRVDQGKGVVLLTDMFGGTPSNLAISLMGKPGIEVVAGVNLPMLIKLATLRGTTDIQDAVNQAQDAGRKYINVASNLLSKTPKAE